MTMTIGFLLAGGLALLGWGGDALVRGASRIAAVVGISPLVVGLTIVACGTSAPELAVSVIASWSGSADVAAGNVVGSNIFNVAFILGLCALVVPLTIAPELLRRDMPIVAGTAALCVLLGIDGRIAAWEGGLLFALAVVYTVVLIRGSADPAAEGGGKPGETGGPAPASSGRKGRELAVSGAWCLAGLVGLVLGARWFVEGASDLARSLGISELIIGLTIVAGGTSLPEVATSLVASWKGERGIAVGNVVGSNIYNTLLILGVAALVSPGGLALAPALQQMDVPIMLGISVLLVVTAYSGRRIGRSEGLLFLGVYGAYIVLLVTRETDPSRLAGLLLPSLLLLPFAAWIVLRGYRRG